MSQGAFSAYIDNALVDSALTSLVFRGCNKLPAIICQSSSKICRMAFFPAKEYEHEEGF